MSVACSIGVDAKAYDAVVVMPPLLGPLHKCRSSIRRDKYRKCRDLIFNQAAKSGGGHPHASRAANLRDIVVGTSSAAGRLTSEMRHPRRFDAVRAMSGSRPTPDVSLRRREGLKRARSCLTQRRT